MVNPETGGKIESWEEMQPWQLKLLKQFDGSPLYEYKRKADSIEVSDAKNQTYKDDLKENLTAAAKSMLELSNIFLKEQTEGGKLIGGELTEYDPHQIIERIESKMPDILKEYVHHPEGRIHGNKREILRVHKENYLSQIIHFRTALFIMNGDLKLQNVESFLDKVEKELSKNTFEAINAGKYDSLFDSTSEFIEQYGSTVPAGSAKENRPDNKTRFWNMKVLANRYKHERVDKFRKDYVDGDDSNKPNPRDLTRTEFLAAMGETDLKTGLDTWAYIASNEVIKIFNEFNPNKRKEDLRKLKKGICDKLDKLFGELSHPTKLYDYDRRSEYLPVNLVDAQYAPTPVQIYQTDVSEGKLPCQLAHWVAENYCPRGEDGNFVVPCSSHANNHQQTKNHNLFWYIGKCIETAGENKLATKLFFETSLKAQEIEVNLDEVYELYLEKSKTIHKHYEDVSDKQDAIKKFKQALEDYGVDV